LYDHAELLVKENDRIMLELEDLREQVKLLKVQIDTEKAKNRDLLIMKREHVEKQNEMQTLFLDCVNAVKADI
jgi:regulator of replication initiation timing